MGTIFNSKVFKGVSIAGKKVKGMAKNGVVFWQALPTDYILAYDFNGNTADASVNGLNGAITGTLDFDAGRKAGTQSMKFTNGCVKTILPLPINSDKVSISFWIKTSQVSTGIVLEMSANTGGNNAFYVAVNDNNYKNGINFGDKGLQGYNIKGVQNHLPITTFTHFAIIIDRSLDANQTKFYVNNIVHPPTSLLNVDIIGNWVNNILFIGQRGASSLPFVGNLQDLKIYNRVLSEDEITSLYNE